jgi:hypothetical protein
VIGLELVLSVLALAASLSLTPLVHLLTDAITDEDIDAILSRGEAKTAELKAKFEAVGEES